MGEAERISAGAAEAGATVEAGGDGALGYNPGWTSATWDGAEPEPAPRAGFWRTARGWVRLVAFALTTVALTPVFFIARAIGGRRDRKIAALWCGAGARLCGLTVRQIGKPSASGGALLVNHASWIDILVIGSRAPVHFVAKEEVSGWPIFGWIGRISNTVFIARKRAEAKAQEKLLAERVRGGDLLCLFPEGTSSDGQRVLPFKSSLFSLFFVKDDAAAEATPARPMIAQPVTVHYAPRRGLPRSFYGWWGKMALFGHILAVCRLGGGTVTVHFHEPIDPATAQNRKALAAAAERRVRDGLEAAAARFDALRADGEARGG